MQDVYVSIKLWYIIGLEQKNQAMGIILETKTN